MTRRQTWGAVSAILLGTTCVPPSVSDDLVYFDKRTLSTRAKLKDMRVVEVDATSGTVLVRSGTTKTWPGITLYPELSKNRFWNLEDKSEVATTIENLGDEPLTVRLRIDNPIGSNGRLEPWITTKATIATGESSEIRAVLRRRSEHAISLRGMQRFPQGIDANGIDPSRLSSVLIYVERGEAKQTFRIGPIRAIGTYTSRTWEQMNADEFFPFVDEFGQFQHADWPGKAKSIETLVQQRDVEISELKSHPPPPGRTRYGGWIEGPKLSASGNFRVQKHYGQWWFVDPDGYLFWSHGMGAVRTGSPTVISDRLHYFPPLVSSGDAERQFLQETDVAENTGEESNLRFDFAKSNLRHKYGPDWEEVITQQITTRLKSWGFNTLGLWSDVAIKSTRRLPYTEWLYYEPPRITGASDAGKNMVDMWHPEFAERLRRSAAMLKSRGTDPWLLGVFIDNELPWNDASGFFSSVVRSPPEQRAKQQLIEHLQTKYVEIEKLNLAWNTQHRSWRALLHSRQLSMTPDILTDAKSFMQASAERYYATAKASIAEALPHTLYLCSRFNGRFPIPERAAAKYCDVMSYNLYRNSVADFSVVDDLDLPILISEWHFGAADRGVFGAGLVARKSQHERANSYREYAGGALLNRNVVGAHWYQYLDEPLSGRPLDGENHQIGFVSVTDNPYSEIRSASREIGSDLYAIRYSKE